MLSTILMTILIIPHPTTLTPQGGGLIRGYVIEEGTQRLLPGVKVQLAAGGSDETTNSGRFRIHLPPSIKPGDSLVLITRKPNYRTGEVKINVPSNPDGDVIRVTMTPLSAGTSKKPASPKLAVDPAKVYTALRARPDVVRRVVDPLNKRRDQLQDDEIFAYLDDIASQAVLVANVWEHVLMELTEAKLETDRVSGRKILQKYDIAPPNTVLFSNLMAFYGLLEETLKGRLSNSWADRVIMTLNRLIEARMTTRGIIEALRVRSESSEVFVGQESNTGDLKELSRSVELLYREAAALDVLAKTIRLTKGNSRR
jgi:hypothetical protein